MLYSCTNLVSGENNIFHPVSGQLLPGGKLPPPHVRIGVWVKVIVRFSVGGQPDNCPIGKLSPS